MVVSCYLKQRIRPISPGPSRWVISSSKWATDILKWDGKLKHRLSKLIDGAQCESPVLVGSWEHPSRGFKSGEHGVLKDTGQLINGSPQITIILWPWHPRIAPSSWELRNLGKLSSMSETSQKSKTPNLTHYSYQSMRHQHPQDKFSFFYGWRKVW